MATSVKVWVRLTIGDKKLEDSVHVATGGDISDLRDAVKLKFAEDLIHCCAARLQVFQQEEDALPLEIDSPLPLNTPTRNPLIIKAPINKQVPSAALQAPQLDSFQIERFLETIKLCTLRPIDIIASQDDSTSNGSGASSDTAFLLTSTAQEIGWLDSLLLTKSLFVRKCYQDVSEIIKSNTTIDQCQQYIICGTPGIGKSTFLSYFVYDLIQLQESDLLTDGVKIGESSFSIIVDFGEMFAMITTKKTDQGTEIMVAVDQRSVNAFSHASNNQANYYIFDAREVEKPLLVRAKTVVASSPNRKNYKQIGKLGEQRYYMPPWSYEELLLLHEHCFDETVTEEQLDERYGYYGGVPRECFKRFDVGENIIQGCDAEEVMKMIGSTTVADQSSWIAHRLIHIVPSDDYKRVTIKFGSQKICDAFVSQYYDTCESRFISFINTKTDAVYANLRGQLFEAYAHRLIASGGIFNVRELTSGKNQKSKIVKFPKADTEYFSDMSSCVSCSSSSSSSSSVSGSNHGNDPKYFIPISKSFAVIDSFSDAGLFQMTVSSDHPMIKNHLEEYLKILKLTNPRFYFVVPEDKFDSFKYQPYHSTKNTLLKKQDPIVSQFALCIPTMSALQSHKKPKVN